MKRGSPGAAVAGLTVDYSETIVQTIRRRRSFGRGLLAEAAAVFLNGEADVARLLLRDLVNGTVGFEALARATGTPAKSLHRMLSGRGNPTMDNLAAVFAVLRRALGVELRVRAVKGSGR